jgi:hypothetical protein
MLQAIMTFDRGPDMSGPLFFSTRCGLIHMHASCVEDPEP